ncbi:MAG: pilus assembly protein FimV [Betaproteobacteria bacterium]|nr:MAG: pilus assembly protein FimV [Betaproteobacteria bacterium]
MSRFSIAILAAALSLAAPLAAYAVGLGRLTVLSALGQPLDAEIEIVSLQKGEEQGFSARLAPIEAFRQAGIEPSPVLAGARLTVEQRDGRPVIRIRTPQPVSEPFLEMLVEVQWSAGRLVREYTFLLDPPEYKGPQQAIAAAPVTRPAAPEAQPLPPVEAKPEAAPAPAPAEPAKEPAVAAAPAAMPAENTYEVKKGDTLGQIARQNLPAGVTLNQMLTAIYRANQDAFIRENINLVRAGSILAIPGGDTIGTITAEEANSLVQAHHNEFTEYRSRLAAAPARADTTPGQQAVAGTIEPKPEAAAPAPQRDQLRLSKAEPQKPSAPGARAAREDDAVARERALKEAQSRVADLEKNVADLQKLLELKNQQLAELEKKAAGKPAPAVPAPAPEKPKAEAAKPAPTPEAAKPAPAPATIPPKPAAAPEAKKAEPAAKAKPKAAPPPPAPSLIDEFLENPIALAGLALVVLLLAGYGYWSWRRKKATQAKFQDSVLGAAAGAGAGAAIGAAAAGAAPQAAAAAPAGREPEEVDPIAEADVYMAYGRDAQAEEILKEALQKDATRVPVHAKLLEIYANRKDARAFEQTALKLKSLTGGTGPEWEKAAAQGRSIDPQNGLYGGAPGAPAAVAAAAAVPAAAAAAPTLDFDLGGATTPGTGAPDITLDEGQKSAPPPAVDFDLGAATTPPPGKPTSDFSPGGTLIMEEQKPESTVGGLDFDLNLGAPAEKKAETPAAPPPAAPAETGGGLDFDLNLDLGGGETSAPADKPAPAAAPMDLSSINLDLGSAGEPSTAAAPSNDPKWQEVATKLDLAKAYEEMGDKDGARELLNEVMKDGDAAQKGQAQQLLSKLG